MLRIIISLKCFKLFFVDLLANISRLTANPFESGIPEDTMAKGNMSNLRVLIVVLVLLGLGMVSPVRAAGPIGPQPVVATPLASGTKFASPTGSGTACSAGSPCSLATVVGQVTPGAVVFLRGGTYNITSNLTFAASGTASNKITFESYPGESAILDGGTLAEGTQVFIRLTGNDNVLRKLEIRNMPAQGLYVPGNRNILDGLWVHHNKLVGIHIHGTYTTPYGALASYNIVQNTTVSDNSDAGLGDGGDADGISISSGTGNQILYCLANHNSDDGFDVWRSQNSRIAYSVSTNNGIANGNGMGFKIGGAVPSSGSRVDHNLAYNNRTAGFDTNSSADGQYDYNTSWNNDADGYVLCTGAAACIGNTVVKRSIASANGTMVSGTGTQTINSWQRGGTAAFISVNPASPDFLRPTVDGGFEDIGAYANAVVISDSTPPAVPINLRAQ